MFGTGRAAAACRRPAPASRATYRIGLGSVGNVGPDTLTVALTALPRGQRGHQPVRRPGRRRPRVAPRRRKISGPGSVIAQERAVTLEDYELLAEGFPGVGKAKARVGLRGGYKVVQVFVAPESPASVPPPFPSAELRDALDSHLEARMPVNRMAGVDVLDPVYVPVDVAVDVHLQASGAAVRSTRAACSRTCSPSRAGIGGAVRVGEVFSALFPIPGSPTRVAAWSRPAPPRPPRHACGRRRADRRARAGLSRSDLRQRLRRPAVTDLAELIYRLPPRSTATRTPGRAARFLAIWARRWTSWRPRIEQLHEDLFASSARG